jgi:hypothetical protein
MPQRISHTSKLDEMYDTGPKRRGLLLFRDKVCRPAPDPIGDRRGDPDWYGYCLDDPVNGVDPAGLMGKAVEPIFRQGIKAGIKAAGKKGAEEKPDNAFLRGVDRFLNGKGLDKDSMASDSDGDGISDYDDEDSDWNQKGKAK